MTVLINIDVPDLKRAVAFYTEAFDLKVIRRFGEDGAELAGWPVSLFLLEKPAGSIGAADQPRTDERHWTPVHLDVAVEDLEAALDRALAAGFQADDLATDRQDPVAARTTIRHAAWGRIVRLADPYGHGWCLLQFSAAGYDAVATPHLSQPH